ncbi:hypothetical protein QYE76_025462 [Lolium multiflorum]|uniref:AP2/ERF domain-containing protein n=1 Tax=Lolium multiflorum TaxID=4521 RepID=A0AAD8RFL9_LOLMU|nr:hypothetical protein QYE76_025462 [Lolium multiflorum]
MPPRRRGASGFRGVRVRPSGRFTAEIRAGGFRLTLGTYNTPELAARAYDAAAWRFRLPGRDMNREWKSLRLGEPGASSCISNGPTKIINGLITCLFFTFPFTFPFTFSILHESITEMSKIAFIDEIIPFFIFFHYNPSFSMLGPTIIAWHETVPKQVHVNIS